MVKMDPRRALPELLGTGAWEPPLRSANVTTTGPFVFRKGSYLDRLSQKISAPLYIADGVGEIPPKRFSSPSYLAILVVFSVKFN